MTRDIVMVVAGHIDHGKTTLVHRLTGVDTDRLQEEKSRGLTIELGFAPLTLPDGQRISFVDVPGHERLVHTMIAGASGVDAFLLVVAADEGVMPQTEEHLDICRALGLTQGVVALTKIDRVDAEWVNLVSEIVAEFLEQRGFKNLPIVPISSTTGEGLDQLRQMLAEIRPTTAHGPARFSRLAIDRAFAVPGAGTIVTGTLRDSPLEIGQRLMIYPQETPVVVRSLQSHGESLSRVEPGKRVAVNLHGVHYRDLHRGQWLAPEGTLSCARTWLAWVHWDTPLKFPENRSRFRFHFHHGTLATVTQLVRLSPATPDGELVLLQLPQPLPGRASDRFLLRRLSPLRFVGWGELIQPLSGSGRFIRKRRRYTAWTPWPSLTWEERLTTWIRLGGPFGQTRTAAVAWCGWKPEAVDHLLSRLEDSGTVFRFDTEKIAWIIDRDTVHRLERKALSALKNYLDDHPLRSGMPLEQWLNTWAPPVDPVRSHLVRLWQEQKKIHLTEGQVVDPSRSRSRAQSIHQVIDELVAKIHNRGFEGLTLPEIHTICKSHRLPPADVVTHLRETYHLVLLKTESSPIVVHPRMIERFKQFLVSQRNKKVLNFQDFKGFFGTSRRIVLAYLGYARDQGWLLKTGDVHRIKL